jgi:hypothetical protein
MASLTLAEAAAQVGCNRTTLLRSIKSGRLSGTRDDVTGSWSVDAAELFRVFPPVAASTTPAPLQQDAHADALVAFLREQLAEMRGQRDEMKGERDAWRGIAERLTNALPKPAAEPKPKPKQTLWQWLNG